ncbi:MAG TPA: KGG domain-containing protein [Candidatus Kapabacteria bacterium]
MSNTSKRGFASMDGEKQRTIASKGGRAAHAKGTAHEWSSEEARAAGRKGGESRGNRGQIYSEQSSSNSSALDYPIATDFLSGAGSLLRSAAPSKSEAAYTPHAGAHDANSAYTAADARVV